MNKRDQPGAPQPAQLTPEGRARLIADAGLGLFPTSKAREAIYDVALAHIRELTKAPTAAHAQEATDG